MRFSIIMPTFGRTELMIAAVRSVLAQTYDDWELMIVDDASGYAVVRDKVAFVDSLNDDRVRLVTNANNVGHAEVRNVGLALTTGDWVKYLDDDDELYPNCLQRLAEVIDHDDPLVITAKYHVIHGDNVRLLGDDFNKVDVFKSCKLDTCCFAHARSCLLTAGGWDNRLRRFADGDIIARYTTMFADRYVHVDDVLSNFMIRDDIPRVSTGSGNLKSLQMVYDRYGLAQRYGKVVVFAGSYADDLVENHNFVTSDFMSMTVYGVGRQLQPEHRSLAGIMKNFNYVATFSGTGVLDEGLEAVRFGRPTTIIGNDVFASTTPAELARVAKHLPLFDKER